VLKTAFTLLGSVLLLLIGLAFSVVVLSFLAVLGLAAWGYFWWKTRAPRRTASVPAEEGLVIEGEATVVEEHPTIAKSALPGDSRGI
jgi:hypothetical protein